jgi:hypothetical protein
LVVTFALLYIKIKGSYPTNIFSDLGLLFASRFFEMCQHVLTHINFFSVVVVQALAQRRCFDGPVAYFTEEAHQHEFQEEYSASELYLASS